MAEYTSLQLTGGHGGATLTAVADARFHSLAYMVDQAVVVTDAANMVRFANPAADRLFEATAGGLIGQPFLLPLKSTKSGAIDISLRSGRLARATAQIGATVWDGAIAWLATFNQPASHAADGLALEAAAQAMRARFLAHLSHELRTPLNTILGFSDVMAREMYGPLGSPRYREYAQAVNQKGRDLLRLMSELLDLSRAESGDLRIDESLFDLSQIILELLPEAQAIGRGGGAQIELGPMESVLLRADKAKIRAALVHLVGNGVAFTPDSGTVTVSAGLTPERRVIIRVIDTGRGLDAEQMAEAFRPFPRARPVEIADARAGVGIGLALVRRYIELHGGAVRIESAPGQGTTVTCMLPSDRVALDFSEERRVTH